MQDYESAAAYISTFFELEARLASHAKQHGDFAEDGQDDVQRKVGRGWIGFLSGEWVDGKGRRGKEQSSSVQDVITVHILDTASFLLSEFCSLFCHPVTVYPVTMLGFTLVCDSSFSLPSLLYWIR